MSHELMQKVAEVRPDVWDYLARTRDEISTSPFRDEILEEMDEAIKTAQELPGMHPLANYGLGIAAGVGAAIATSLGGDLYDAARRGITKGRSYKAMLKANPQLAELDPHRVRSTFDTLHRFNPDFASDPYVAGSYVQRNALLEGGYSDTKELESMIGARKNLHDVRKLQVPTNVPRWDNESRLDKGVKNEQLSKLRHENSDESRAAQGRKLESEIAKNKHQTEPGIKDIAELERFLHEGNTQQAQAFRQWKRDSPPLEYLKAMGAMTKNVKGW